MPRIYVLDVPEFRPLIELSKRNPNWRVSEAGLGYYRVDADGEMEFERRALGFKPAVWYGVFTGGIEGRIVEYGRDCVRIVSDERT
jgi:hypothetical protein